jgi:hypothetical protein
MKPFAEIIITHIYKKHQRKKMKAAKSAVGENQWRKLKAIEMAKISNGVMYQQYRSIIWLSKSMA